MAALTLLARIILDNKRLKTELRKTGKTAHAELKRSVASTVAAMAVVTGGMTVAMKKAVALGTAVARAARTWGVSAEGMKKVANDLAKHGFGKGEDAAADVAGALEELAKQGVETKEAAVDLLFPFARLSDALGTDLTTTVAEVGGSLRAMGYRLEDVSVHSDAFAAVANKTTVGLGDFTSFIMANAESLRTQKLTIEDAAGVLVHLNAQGVSGAQAMGLLNEAVQEGATFAEVFTDRVGLSRGAVKALGDAIGMTDGATRLYSLTLQDTRKGLNEVERAWDSGVVSAGSLVKGVLDSITAFVSGREALDNYAKAFPFLNATSLQTFADLQEYLKTFNLTAEQEAAILTGILTRPWAAMEEEAVARLNALLAAIQAANASGSQGGGLSFAPPVTNPPPAPPPSTPPPAYGLVDELPPIAPPPPGGYTTSPFAGLGDANDPRNALGAAIAAGVNAGNTGARPVDATTGGGTGGGNVTQNVIIHNANFQDLAELRARQRGLLF